ncbi:MAG: AAA family ATPase [Desulfobacterales bacterium]|nr:AAA family ATPase [Desulfobacterales bacterium]
MNGLPVKRACDLADSTGKPEWLIEGLWADQAVGILGGEPKCCKTFLALDMAVSVASGAACLRCFRVFRTAPVLLFPAEDALSAVRKRLEGICAAAHTRLDALPIYVITAPRLLLDLPQDREQLRQTVARINPALLILDPFIRLHRSDENASKEVAPLLGYLRQLQRELHVAVLLVHHVRKGSGAKRPGQTLRGSSDLHGWGDSNLYLRRNDAHLLLSVEHRAAPSRNNIPIELCATGSALALAVKAAQQPTTMSAVTDTAQVDPCHRVIQAMAGLKGPVSVQQLRKLCRMRTATLCETLATLKDQGAVIHGPNGYSLTNAQCNTTVSFPATPIDPPGNGNGKRLRQLPLRLHPL